MWVRGGGGGGRRVVVRLRAVKRGERVLRMQSRVVVSGGGADEDGE